jgi:hypothetical protein
LLVFFFLFSSSSFLLLFLYLLNQLLFLRLRVIPFHPSPEKLLHV